MTDSLLLVNPKLGKVQPGYQWMISREVYDLWPKTLQTCRQIYAEASEVLYGSNTFFFVCVSRDEVSYYGDLHQRCPITRHRINSRDPKTRKVWSRCIESMQKVRRWRVIIGDIMLSKYFGRWSLSPFCREICNASLPPTSLEILIMSEEGTGVIPVAEFQRGEQRSLVEIVQALRILRNIGELGFGNAKAADCPQFYEYHHYKITYRDIDDTLETGFYNAIPVYLQVELRSLVTGNSPVELSCNMNQCLLNYAKINERYKPYRDDMGINRTRYAATLHGLSLFNRYSPGETYDKNRLPREFWLSLYWAYPDSCPPREGHPVESGLGDCSQAVHDNDDTTFKANRTVVLQYLERQYRRIVKASRDIHRFINIHKVSYGLLDINREMESIESPPERNYHRMYRDNMMERYAAKGCVLLEAYADALKRELTLSAKVTIARMRSEFEGYYSFKPREIAIQAVIDAMTNTQDGWSYGAWADNFIIAFNDMENQLEEIQDTRRNIFHCDISLDWGCDFNVELGQTNRKRVDWSVNGPGVMFYSRLTWGDHDDDDDDEPIQGSKAMIYARIEENNSK